MSKAFIKGEAEGKNCHESKQQRSVTVKLSGRLRHQALGARQTLVTDLKPAAAAALDVNIYIIDTAQWGERVFGRAVQL